MRQSALQSFHGRGTQFQVSDQQSAQLAKFREELQSGACDVRPVKIDRPEMRESCDRFQANVGDGAFCQEQMFEILQSSHCGETLISHAGRGKMQFLETRYGPQMPQFLVAKRRSGDVNGNGRFDAVDPMRLTQALAGTTGVVLPIPGVTPVPTPGFTPAPVIQQVKPSGL